MMMVVRGRACPPPVLRAVLSECHLSVSVCLSRYSSSWSHLGSFFRSTAGGNPLLPSKQCYENLYSLVVLVAARLIHNLLTSESGSYEHLYHSSTAVVVYKLSELCALVSLRVNINKSCSLGNLNYPELVATKLTANARNALWRPLCTRFMQENKCSAKKNAAPICVH